MSRNEIKLAEGHFIVKGDGYLWVHMHSIVVGYIRGRTSLKKLKRLIEELLEKGERDDD